MRRPIMVALLAGLTGCSDQPLGPDRQVTIEVLGSVVPDSIRGGPADTVALEFRVADAEGRAISGATARYRVEGEGAGILSPDPVTALDGRLEVRWLLGTRSTEEQRLTVEVLFAGRSHSLVLSGRVVPTVIAGLLAPDTLATRLHTPSPLAVVATDPYGNVFVPAAISYHSTDTTVFVVDSGGVIQGRGRGVALAVATSGGHADTSIVRIFQVAGSIAAADSLPLHSLGQVAGLSFTILSDSGNPIRDTLPMVVLSDSTVAALLGPPSDSALSLQARDNGTATLTLAVGAVEHQVTVLVRQQSASVVITPGSVPDFVALGDSVLLDAAAYDSLGVALTAPVFSWSSGDSGIARVSAGGWVTSTGNGTTAVMAGEAGGASASLPIIVAQVPDSLEVFWTDTSAIVSAAQFAPPPLVCRSLDRNGAPLTASPAVNSRSGTLLGQTCATLTVRASGHDTLTFTAGSLTTVLTPAIAVRPLVSSPAGEFVALDSFPFDYRLWAPSARTNSQGQVEIYVTGYLYVLDSNGVGPGALHRLVSPDGVNFQYDSLALDLLPPPCELICSGIENIAVVPRADGPGWRMLFAAGSSGSYGWQVFSAVSTDERTWTMEPGVRITNGGPVPPDPPGTVPWPVGEGMVVDQLPGGDWRMIVGGYQRVPSPPSRFEIVEYRSPDQLTWTYQGARLTTGEMPAAAQRSIYSPSIVEVAPGIWRMFLTGDDLNVAGGRSRVFTAVSLDRDHWEFESELLGAPGTDLYYTALANGRLYFLRQDAGQLRRLAAVSLTMP